MALCELSFDVYEQRTNIKFCVLLKKSPAETLQLLTEAYGAEAMKKSQVYEWHKRFREGRMDIADDPRSGRPSTAIIDEKIEQVRQVVHANRRISIDEIASKVNLSHGSVHSILHDRLGMHRICSRIVPKMLTPDHKEHRMITAGELIDAADADSDFLKKIVTGDETWCFLYDPQTKRQSSEWKSKTSPRREKFRLDKSKGKVMLEVFFDYKGLIHYEFIPEGRTVNKELYVEILRRLRDAIRRKRPEKWAANNWVLLHDNAPAHRSLLVGNYLAKNNVTTLEHPPYSPDLAPADFFLFPRLKSSLKGKRFADVEDVRENATKVLKDIQENEFHKCFEQLYDRWGKCVVAGGEYFEGK
jgi:histone-lysine N-methyltransferase SETMAR